MHAEKGTGVHCPADEKSSGIYKSLHSAKPTKSLQTHTHSFLCSGKNRQQRKDRFVDEYLEGTKNEECTRLLFFSLTTGYCTIFLSLLPLFVLVFGTHASRSDLQGSTGRCILMKLSFRKTIVQAIVLPNIKAPCSNQPEMSPCQRIRSCP